MLSTVSTIDSFIKNLEKYNYVGDFAPYCFLNPLPADRDIINDHRNEKTMEVEGDFNGDDPQGRLF